MRDAPQKPKPNPRPQHEHPGARGVEGVSTPRVLTAGGQSAPSGPGAAENLAREAAWEVTEGSWTKVSAVTNIDVLSGLEATVTNLS